MAYSGKFSPKNPQKYRGDFTNIVYRSTWECRVMTWLDNNDSIIEGMYIESNALNSFYNDKALISKYSTKSDKITYLTDDGYLSIITGHYNSVSPYFVTLLYSSVDYLSMIKKSNLIVAEKSWLVEKNFDISSKFQGLDNILVDKIAENSNVVIYSVERFNIS